MPGNNSSSLAALLSSLGVETHARICLSYSLAVPVSSLGVEMHAWK
jgi:hypothetical protein